MFKGTLHCQKNSDLYRHQTTLEGFLRRVNSSEGSFCHRTDRHGITGFISFLPSENCWFRQERLSHFNSLGLVS